MNDEKIALSKFNLEEVSKGLDKISYMLNDKVVCLHTDMRKGVPDSQILYLIKNFNALGIKKLIITSFPIPKKPEDWMEMLAGEKYIIENVPSHLEKDDNNYSIKVEQFLTKHKENFKVNDNSKQPVHIEIIKEADVLIGFPDANILESYENLIDRYYKHYIVGGYVTEDNISNYLKAYEIRYIEVATIDISDIREYFYENMYSLIWLDNFDMPLF